MSDVSDRPVPHPTDVSRPHWDGCRRGELLVQRCGACGHVTFPPTRLCSYCHATDRLEWQRSSGRGVVYSSTVIHRPPSPAFEAPFVVAIVEVEEGWHLFTNIVGCPPEAVTIGLPVRVTFEAVDGDTVLPCFRPDPERGDRP